MTKPQKDCVADTSALVSLAKGEVIGCLGKIFRKVYIPQEVQRECRDPQTAAAIERPYFEVKKVENILPVNLHPGELEAISLASELGIDIILVNDQKARKKALEHNFKTLSFADILIIGKRAGFIESVKMAMDTMRTKGEGIENRLYNDTLKEAGEL